MTDFFARAADVRAQWDVLRHPFYVRWARGELAPGELAFYSGQYRHAVVALADATAQVGNDRHAAEERGHVGLWDEFLEFAGGDRDATPTPQTAACAAAWANAGRDRTATLAALYAIEAAQPAISETKRAGLIEHYGATPDTNATRYFDVHAKLDHVHAEHDRDELAAAMQSADEPRLIDQMERVLKANWQLLDGVQERAALPA